MTKSGNDPRDLGSRLTKIRRLKGYTQQFMAQQLGISERQYGRYEAGDNPIPEELLRAACDTLEVKEEDLLAFDERTLFSNCTGALGVNSNNVFHAASEKERELYEARIRQLEGELEHLRDEVRFLRRQLDANDALK